MLGGVDVVVDRVWREIERATPGLALIGIQDWTFEGDKRDSDGRAFLHANFPAPSATKPLALRYLLTALRRIPALLFRLREQNIRVVNFHFPRLNAYPLALMKYLGLWRGRIVLSFHGSDVRQLDLGSPAWRLIASQTDAITACSGALADRIGTSGLFERTRIQVVYNGIDREHFQAPPGESGGTPSRRFILNVGTYVPGKAQDVLIKAFAEIAGRFPDMDVVFAGGTANGEWLTSLRQLATELGVARRVCFLENIPQRRVAALMSQAACLAHASLDEAFGLVVIEAGASRLPVIATEVGGVPEIIPSTDYGLLVKPGDVAEMAAALDAVLCAPQEAQRRAEKLQDRVDRAFSVEAMARGYLNICMER